MIGNLIHRSLVTGTFHDNNVGRSSIPALSKPLCLHDVAQVTLTIRLVLVLNNRSKMTP